MDVTIYVLRHPTKGRVQYVGQTTYPLGRRLEGHLGDAMVALKHGRCMPRHHWILSLRRRGLRPVIEGVYTFTPTGIGHAKRVEREWMEKFAAGGARLLNLETSPRWMAIVKARSSAKRKATWAEKRARRAA